MTYDEAHDELTHFTLPELAELLLCDQGEAWDWLAVRGIPIEADGAPRGLVWWWLRSGRGWMRACPKRSRLLRRGD